MEAVSAVRHLAVLLLAGAAAGLAALLIFLGLSAGRELFAPAYWAYLLRALFSGAEGPLVPLFLLLGVLGLGLGELGLLLPWRLAPWLRGLAGGGLASLGYVLAVLGSNPLPWRGFWASLAYAHLAVLQFCLPLALAVALAERTLQWAGGGRLEAFRRL
ncbi:MAG: hypothetical protein IRZ26_05985 [Clostridia bacterium]|nr:hypothetical protein [Clostridia bacterium]